MDDYIKGVGGDDSFILEKPSARETMRRLSDEAARGAGLPAAPNYDEDGLKVVQKECMEVSDGSDRCSG